MKHFTFILIFIALILVLSLAVFYLSKRTAFVFDIKPTWFYVGYAVLLLAAYGVMAGAMHWQTSGWFAHLVIISNQIVLGILLYLLLCGLVVDLVQLFAHFSPKVFGIVVASLTILVSGYMMWNAASPRLKTVKIAIPKLEKPYRIVQLSDMHLGQFRGKDFLQNIVNEINEIDNVDAVMITGDMFDSYYNYSEETLTPLKQIKVPIYFVNGNHDIYIDDVGIKEKLRKMSVHVLENEVANCKGLQIIGLNYMRPNDTSTDMMHVPMGKETMASVLPTLPIDSTLPTILLHHNPLGAELLAPHGIDLYLSGHTHAGQLFPLTLINGSIFEYNKGLHQVQNAHIYVSAGLGTFGMPMRLGTHSEITIIELVRG